MTDRRLALVVTVDRHDDPGLRDLAAPSADAAALAEVLGDDDLGGFELEFLHNPTSWATYERIEALLADRRPSDLVLLHFSGHGLKDLDGELYLAATNTVPDRLASSAVEAAWVNRLMQRSRAQRIVLLLDCCYGGAFERGVLARADERIDVGDQFRGRLGADSRGRVVITASTAMEYAFESAGVSDGTPGRPSVFTAALAEGIRTGAADRDQDGLVALDELYDYVYDRVREQSGHQTPCKWEFGLRGDLYVARNPFWRERPAALPTELLDLVEHPSAAVRLAAVHELAAVTGAAGPAARGALARLADDDSRRVSAAATDALDLPPAAAPPAAAPPAAAPPMPDAHPNLSAPADRRPPARRDPPARRPDRPTEQDDPQSPRPEAASLEAARSETARRETARPETARPHIDRPQIQRPRLKGQNKRPGVNGPGVNGPGLDGRGVSGPGPNGPGVSGPGVSGPGVSGPGVRGPGLNGPRIGGPRAEGLEAAAGRRRRAARAGISAGVVLVVALMTGLTVNARGDTRPTARTTAAPAATGANAAPAAPAAPPAVLGKIKVGREPEGVAVSPDGATVYVADQGSHSLFLVDAVHRRVRADVRLPTTPRFVAVSADGARAFVAMYDDDMMTDGVAIVDTRSGRLEGVVPTGPMPFALAVAPDGKVWVPIHMASRVQVIDPDRRVVVADLRLPPSPHAVAFGGPIAYTADHESNEISVIDTAGNRVEGAIPAGHSPHHLVLTPDGGTAVVADYDGDTATIIDLRARRIRATVPVGHHPQSVGLGAGDRAAIVNEGDGTVTVLALPAGRRVATVRVGTSPRSIAVAPDGRTAYVSDGGEGALSVLRLA